YNNYIEGLNSDKKLYEMFKDEEVNMEDLEEQVKKINKTYEMVYENNQTFNELTKKYNELKVDFYNEAGIKIKMNEEKEEK
ncbi:YkyA family protein, partial [Niallia sp.]|uniref:YkyA family protein n=1 Tax=Niallia sp. TaxID=2837523 RepID=UPI00289A2A0E